MPSIPVAATPAPTALMNALRFMRLLLMDGLFGWPVAIEPLPVCPGSAGETASSLDAAVPISHDPPWVVNHSASRRAIARSLAAGRSRHPLPARRGSAANRPDLYSVRSA